MKDRKAYTPGPWHAVPQVDQSKMIPILQNDDLCLIAYVGAKGRPNIGNARMIAASASMYEALLIIADAIGHDEESHRFGKTCPRCVAIEAISEANGKRKPAFAKPIQDEEIQFRDIEGSPGYRVSNFGSVQSDHVRGGMKKRRPGYWNDLALSQDGKGYRYVWIKRKRFSVHTLVLTHFVGPAPDGHECCHWDGDPSNNNLKNLRWDTHVENAADAVRHNRVPSGELHWNSSMTSDQVVLIKTLHAKGVRNCDIARQIGCSKALVSLIVKGKRWKHIEVQNHG